jgi:hypothetical protein
MEKLREVAETNKVIVGAVAPNPLPFFVECWFEFLIAAMSQPTTDKYRAMAATLRSKFDLDIVNPLHEISDTFKNYIGHKPDGHELGNVLHLAEFAAPLNLKNCNATLLYDSVESPTLLERPSMAASAVLNGSAEYLAEFIKTRDVWNPVHRETLAFILFFNTVWRRLKVKYSPFLMRRKDFSSMNMHHRTLYSRDCHIDRTMSSYGPAIEDNNDMYRSLDKRIAKIHFKYWIIGDSAFAQSNRLDADKLEQQAKAILEDPYNRTLISSEKESGLPLPTFKLHSNRACLEVNLKQFEQMRGITIQPQRMLKIIQKLEAQSMICF